jgi:LCP family protein required for cell wall assembly
MADGRDGGRGDDRDGGGSSYDWLYAGGSGASGGQGGPPADDPDATRVISGARAPSRGSARGGDDPPTRIAPTPGGPSGPPPPSARRARTKPRRKRSPVRWVLLLLVAWVAYLVAVPVFAWLSVDSIDAEPGGDRPADQPGTTYLVVGSDGREGLAGERTDTIMLLHIGSGPDLLMSIPRDSIVDIPEQGTNKINAAFALGGPELLVRTVESETGIRVDHYVEIGFDGFVGLVDAVGGVEICPRTAIKDPLADLDVEKGCQEADGETALGYARTRKTATGDIERGRNQREVVSAIGSEVVSWQTIVNPVRYWRVMFGGASSVSVSEGTGPIDAGRFAYAMTRVDGSDGLTCTVPIADLEVNWDSERAPRLFGLIREDRTDEVGDDLCTPTGMPQ